MRTQTIVQGFLLILIVSACSKKSLTDLAANENQNSSNDSSGNGGSNNGGSVANGNTGVYLLNRDVQAILNNGTIVKYNSTSDAYDLVYDDPQDRKLTYGAEDVNQSQYRLPGIRHNSESWNGRFLLIGDDQDQNFTHYNLGYFDEVQNTLTTINLNFTNNEIAYSGHHAMLTASDGFNYIINPTGFQGVDDVLSLNGTTESLKSTTNYYPLGKGRFIANSFAQGQSVTDKFIIFNADDSAQIIRTSTNHLINQVLKYTEDSALILTKNAAGDQAVYFYRYADNYLLKIFEALVSSDVIKINENVNLGSNGNYQLLIRNTTQNKHILYEINQSTGVMSVAAEQDATGLTNSLFQCDQYSFDRGTNSGFYHWIQSGQQVYTDCSQTGTNKHLIVIDLTQSSIQNYAFTTAYSPGTFIFQYKGEFYFVTSGGFITFSVSNNVVSFGADNQGIFKNDNIAKCNTLAPSGYNCSQMELLGSQVQSDHRMPLGGMILFGYMITDGVTPMGIYIMSDINGDKNVSFKFQKPDVHIGYGKLFHEFSSQSYYVMIPDDY